MDLAASYTHCCQLTRRSARNFYYAFLALPAQKRRAMCALYAFLRRTDDIGDGGGDVEERRGQLDAWRFGFTRMLGGEYDDPILPALHDTMLRHEIPAEYLEQAIDGVAMDLGPVAYETFEELADYCYHVASVVGLACIHIWGFRGEEAREYAVRCGIAFQLTNILRDLHEDALRGRVYLPAEDLRQFDYSGEELREGRCNKRFRRLMAFEVQRARGYYEASAPLSDLLDPVGRPVFRAMRGIYGSILNEIERRDYDVFSARVALKPWRKLMILTRSFFGEPRGANARRSQPEAPARA